MNKKILVVLLLGMFMISFASAGMFNSKNTINGKDSFTLNNKVIPYNNLWKKYNPIEIKGLFGLGNTKWKGAITNHTETCGENCFSEMEIYLVNSGSLIDDITFKTLQEDNSWKEQNIRSYNFQYWGNITDYQTICTNGTMITYPNQTTYTPQICNQVISGYHEGWIDYNLGTVVPAGEYTLKLNGEKKPSRTVDWIVKTNGEILDEWAVWGNISEGDDAEIILNSPTDNSISYSNEIQFNASAEVTGGATLTNISLWTNETGDWEERNSTSFDKIVVDDGLTIDAIGTLNALGYGWKITATRNATLNTVVKNSASGATLAYLQDYNGGTTYATAVFVGNNATFPNNATIVSGTDYRIIANAGGVTPVSLAGNNSGFTTPISTDYFNIIKGINENTEVNDQVFTWDYITVKENSTSSTQTFTRTLDDTTLWNVQACDSDGDCGFATSNYTLSIDTIAPTITITSPESVIDTHSIGNELLLNATITDTNLDTCWYEYNNTNNTFSCTSGVLASEGFNTVESGQSITVWANDSVGNVNSETQSWTYNFVENSATYDATTYETAQETLTLNFTTEITVQSISANLIYNTSSYTSTSSCNGSTCNLNNTIDIPLLTGGTPVNNTFYWEFTIFDGTGSNTYNSTSRTQEVNNITLIECDATYTTKALNFTAYDEGNLSKLEPFEFEGTFNYWLGDGSIYKTYSLSDTSTNETDLCISPTDENFDINASIEFDSSALGTTYTKRSYFFEDHQINSSLQNITLLLLDSEDSTSFIQEVLEEQVGVENAYIYTYRYYPGEDEYKITQITKTDSSGSTIGFYEAETTNYKHLIYVNNVLRLEETEGKAIPSSAPYTITFYLGEEVETPFEVYDDELDLNKSLSFNSDTNIVSFSYTDKNSTNEGGRLLTLQEKYAIDDVTIYNGTSALSSALLSSDVSNYTGNFISQAFITRNGEEILVDSIRFTIDDKRDTFGDSGVLLAWFIILVAMCAFLYDAVVGLIAVNLSIILVNLIGFVSFGLTYIFGILIVSITIMWLMKK